MNLLEKQFECHCGLRNEVRRTYILEKMAH